jgi:hypothetical protein
VTVGVRTIRGYKMRGKVSLAIAIVAILIGSTLAGYYLEFGPSSSRHDVILSRLTLSSDNVNQGDSLLIEVVVLNNGTVTETFDVNTTYDGIFIGEQNVTSLMAGNTQTLVFSWNTVNVAGGNHTVTATAAPARGQSDLSNISKSTEVQIVAPSLVYDFNGTILIDQYGYNHGGSFLGWNTSGDVTNNETDAVAIHYPGSISREFTSLSSKVSISFDWSVDAVMIVSRQLNGVYSDLTYSYGSSDELAYTNATSFDVDKGTTFTVRFEAGLYEIAFVYRVKLWASDESS